MDPRIDYLLALLDRYRTELGDVFDAAAGSGYPASRAEAGWSVAQVLEHLVITERAVTTLLSDLVPDLVRRSEDEGFDPAAFAEHVDMPHFLDRSRKIRGAQPPGRMDAAEAWEALATSRAELIARLETARGLRLEDASHAHPVTGRPLDAYQWVAFLGLHEARHAAQIREIISKVANPEGSLHN